MKRIPEPELMEDEEQVRAYAGADFEDAHRNFITLFHATFGHNLRGYVLDLGCGHGDITMRFARAYPKCIVHGVDGSEAMIRCGKGILKEAHDIQDRVVLIRGMLPASVLPCRKYDIVISNSLLHHLAMPHTLYQCIERYAVSGAPVFIMDLRRPQTTGEANALVQTYAAHEPEILKRDFYNWGEEGGRRGHTLISDYVVDKSSSFCYLVCHDKTMAHRIRGGLLSHLITRK